MTDSYTRYKRKKLEREGKIEPQERPLSASEDTVLSIDLAQNSPEQSTKYLDFSKITKLTQFGYPEDYIVNAMNQMQPNYCTAGYYLLEMD